MTGAVDDLTALQKWMQNALIHPEAVSAQATEGVLTSTDTLSGRSGLAIYQRSYFLRIASCMREQFPALCHALGQEVFNGFTDAYIRAHPPESYTLYDLGRRFAGYLQDSRPDKDAPPSERESWIDFMVDLARFERQVFVLFDAPGQEGKVFATIETPDDRLRLQPCFATARYQFPVAAYYHDVRAKTDPDLPNPEPSFVAFVRTDYLTRTILISEPHHVFLNALVQGCTVDAALDTVADHMQIDRDGVMRSWRDQDGLRRRWIESGFFIETED